MSKIESQATQLSLSRTELLLTRTFLVLRICLYFFVLPTLRTIWYREPLPPYDIVSQLSITDLLLLFVGD